MTVKEKSKYGKGFIYNLILFAKHWYQGISFMKRFGKEMGSLNFFNVASDHLFEFKIPEQFRGREIDKLTKQFQDFCLELGHGSKMWETTERDFEKAFEMLEELAQLIDKELGINDIEAEWN